MSVDQIKEHISPQTKRAAAISTAMSSVVVLHGVGATNDGFSKLPLIGLELRAEWAPWIFAAMTLALFVMWLFRYRIERQFTGQILQADTIRTNKDLVDLKISEKQQKKKLEQREANFLQSLNNGPLHDRANCFDIDDSAKDGFKVNRVEATEAVKIPEWDELENRRKTVIKLRNHLPESQTVSEKFNSLDDSFKGHSDLAYVAAPIATFLAAVVVTGYPIIERAIALIAVR